MPDTTIVRAAIHPTIGIARVGDSPDEYFLGPEVDRPVPQARGSYKDGAGALKRQAARFRVYGLNAAGEVVRELTPDSWTVHVANQKSAWYEFQLALDIPEASAPDLPPSLKRNATIADRASLVIDPGPRTISGAGEQGPEYAFDSGSFCGTPVYLGELRTDADGRLIFLGGHGVSASYDGSPATTFANNDKWHDDTADGPVTATVTIDGAAIPVAPAWVAVAPPNYAPDAVPVRTLHDLVYDVFVQNGTLPPPEQVSFTEHVYPILERMSGLQWVNHGWATAFGFGGREDLLAPDTLAKLASADDEHAELRQQIASAFRAWDRDGMSPLPWPWLYGDAMNVPAVSPRQHLMLSASQMSWLQAWAAGKFVPGFDPSKVAPIPSLDDVPLADQPAMLDRASLGSCLADAFHPGCELTWPMRHATMYSEPFRILPREGAEPDFGPQLTPAIALAPGGPLYGQAPGSLSRWMAVPWQCDTASCRSGYGMGFGPTYDPYLPTFWPARVPNQALTEADYEIVMDTQRSPADRQQAFERRATWLRFLEGQYQEQINHMISSFGELGVIELAPGPGDAGFPAVIGVESEVSVPAPDTVAPDRNSRMLHVPEARVPEAAPAAIARAIEAHPATEEQLTAGYLEVVKRFGGRRRAL